MLNIAKAAIEPYLAYIKIAFGTVLVVLTISFFGWVGWLHHQVGNLTEQNTKLQSDNKTARESIKTLKGNYKICWDANQGNLKTISQLTSDRATALASLEKLAKEKKIDKKKYDDLTKQVKEMAKDPKNDGAISPILRQTIRSIQENSK